MTVWTVQPRSALAQLEQTGTYRCRKELSFNLSKHNSLQPQYRWLMEQMQKRIGSAPEGVEYPIWAWHTWDFVHRCPDPDSAAFLQRGEDKVLLTLDIPEDDLVLTDFDAWQLVMLDTYLMDEGELGEQEQLEEQLENLSEEVYQQVVEQSWQRVFDVRPLNRPELQRGRYVQATFWEIKREYVSHIEVLKAQAGKV